MHGWEHKYSDTLVAATYLSVFKFMRVEFVSTIESYDKEQ